MSKSVLHLDLHPIAQQGNKVDEALLDMFDEAEAKGVKSVEIIHGKGSGQLKKRVLRFLDWKEIQARYKWVEKDAKNSGRTFVHFR